ncbi:DinB family protein, partial [Mycobacterium noviomagense]
RIATERRHNHNARIANREKRLSYFDRPNPHRRRRALAFWVVQDSQMRLELPQLAAEDHTCDVCDMVYQRISVDDAVTAIADLPAAVREAVLGIPPEARRWRPSPQVWSVAEYVCHLRDVYMSFTIRLHRARKEDCPAVEPMFNDLRARRFRYNDCDLAATLAELAAAASGFCEEVARMKDRDWDRVITRLPDEQRTARWLVRQAMHEGIHHLGDIRRIASLSG